MSVYPLVVEYSVCDCCRKNEFYVARFIPLFREHIGLDLNVENMLIELLRDNQ